MERRSSTLRRADIAPAAAQRGLFDAEDVGGATAPPAPAEAELTGSPARGDGRRLDDLVVEVWEGLSDPGAVPCPLCAGTMVPAGGRGPAVGQCVDCGTAALVAT